MVPGQAVERFMVVRHRDEADLIRQRHASVVGGPQAACLCFLPFCVFIRFSSFVSVTYILSFCLVFRSVYFGFGTKMRRN